MKTITIKLTEEEAETFEAARTKVAMLRGLKSVSEAETIRAALELLASTGLPAELAPVDPKQAN